MAKKTRVSLETILKPRGTESIQVKIFPAVSTLSYKSQWIPPDPGESIRGAGKHDGALEFSNREELLARFT